MLHLATKSKRTTDQNNNVQFSQMGASGANFRRGMNRPRWVGGASVRRSTRETKVCSKDASARDLVPRAAKDTPAGLCRRPAAVSPRPISDGKVVVPSVKSLPASASADMQHRAHTLYPPRVAPICGDTSPAIRLAVPQTRHVTRPSPPSGSDGADPSWDPRFCPQGFGPSGGTTEVPCEGTTIDRCGRPQQVMEPQTNHGKPDPSTCKQGLWKPATIAFQRERNTHPKTHKQ